MSKTYNGCTNYETWLVKLWIDNEESAQNYWKSVASECLENAEATTYSTQEEEAITALADHLEAHHKDTVTEGCGIFHQDLGTASVFHDLLNSALQEVNWREIAKCFINDAKETAND